MILSPPMFSTEWLMELRLLLKDYALTKWELLAFFLVFGLLYRLPAILKHRREMAVIKADFAVKGTKLEAKIDAEKEKRRIKSLKGNK